MPAPSHCSVCEGLPTLSKRNAGRLWQCPGCGSDLITTRRNGGTYQLVAATPLEGAWRPAKAVAAVAAAALLFGAGLLTAALVHRQYVPTLSRESGRQFQVTTDQPSPATSAATDEHSNISDAVLAPREKTPARKSLVLGQTKATPSTDVEAALAEGLSPEQWLAKLLDLEMAKQMPPDPALLSSVRMSRTAEMLRKELLEWVKEVSLEVEPLDPPKDVKQARAAIEKQVETIAKLTTGDLDAFVRNLKETRPDLAGLPWRRGASCQLNVEQAHTLQRLSLTIHGFLGSGKVHMIGDPKSAFRYFLATRDVSSGAAVQPQAIPRLEQILEVESIQFRHLLVAHAATFKHPDATAAIARRAVFDLDEEVRLVAIDALRNCSSRDVVPALVQYFHHPWAPAAQSAAEALAALGLTEVLPVLVNLLEEPDPGAPFFQTVEGKQIPVVRELVRVNHLRNCLLCHAPASRNDVIVPAPIPIPVKDEDVAGSSKGYHGRGIGTRAEEGVNSWKTGVRVDVTYLKQDFSVMQPVAKPGALPELQRFDYLVRIRPLSAAELAAFAREQNSASSRPLSEHKEAILYALRELSGRDAGTSFQAWQKVIADMARKRQQ